MQITSSQVDRPTAVDHPPVAISKENRGPLALAASTLALNLMSTKQHGIGQLEQVGLVPKTTPMAEVHFSPTSQFALVNKQSLYLNSRQVTSMNKTFAKVGSPLRVMLTGAAALEHAGQVLQKVKLTMCDPEVKLGRRDRLWQRLREKESTMNKFLTFADCARSAGVAAGINYDAQRPNEVLSLRTGVVPIQSKMFFLDKNVKGSLAARAEASFYLHAFPLFFEQCAGLNAPPDVQSYLDKQLGKLEQSPAQTGSKIYRYLESRPEVFEMFCDHFGINDQLDAKPGVAVVQVGIEDAKVKSPEEHWNFHWETALIVDGDQYLTLGNLATEYSELDAADQLLNNDLMTEKAKNSRQVNDIVNDKYFFKVYDAGQKSFHTNNLQDEHSAPHGLTLAVASGPEALKVES